MLTVIVLCLLLCAYFVRGQIKWRNAYKLPPSFPGALPIIGHAHIFISSSKDMWFLIKKLSECCIERGAVIYCEVFGKKCYLITDPEDALTVNNSCLQKTYIYDFAKKWIGESLIISGGETYDRHRKILAPKFSTSAVYSFLKLFNDQARKLCLEMESFSAQKHFNPKHVIKNVALETSYLVTFGSTDFIKVDSLMHKYITAAEETMQMFTYRSTQLYLQINFIYRLLGYQRKEDLLINNITTIAKKIVQAKKGALKNNHQICSDFVNNQEKYKSLLDYLFDQNLLTDEEIRAELDSNIISSFDTIAQTLMNMLLLVGTYPEIQNKIYDELIQVLGTERDVVKYDLQKLIYTKAVIKESLRILPPAPIISRYVDKDVKLKHYTIPAKSQSAILLYGINRSPAWGPDAAQFKPERWLDQASLPSDTNYFASFSLGKRSCIGISYAMSLLTVFLAHFVRRNKWTADINKVKLQFNVSLGPVAGHEISIERRM